MERRGLSQRHACGLEADRATVRYQGEPPDDGALGQRLRELAALGDASGTGIRRHLATEGRVWLTNAFIGPIARRSYSSDVAGANVRRNPDPNAGAGRINQGWSLDFVGHAERWAALSQLCVVDAFTRESLATEVDTSLGGVRVARVLDRLRPNARCPRR